VTGNHYFRQRWQDAIHIRIVDIEGAVSTILSAQHKLAHLLSWRVEPNMKYKIWIHLQYARTKKLFTYENTEFSRSSQYLVQISWITWIAVFNIYMTINCNTIRPRPLHVAVSMTRLSIPNVTNGGLFLLPMVIETYWITHCLRHCWTK
jgi:hypothetical protein